MEILKCKNFNTDLNKWNFPSIVKPKTCKHFNTNFDKWDFSKCIKVT